VASSSRLVLLVDDYADNLDLYAEYLTMHGYAVLVARNGADAVTLARAERPALILMDLEMPGMNGIDALKILRTDDTLAHTVIVALTAHALERELAEARQAGFDEVISKPCLPDDLLAAVERLLTERRQTQSLS
jgi:CheY-like chemotaxis protein